MENDILKESNESFESVIQPLTKFVNCVLSLSANYNLIYYDVKRIHLTIDFQIQKHLNNPQNIRTLQHYIKVLKRVTDKVIEEAIPDGIINDADELFFPNDEVRIRSVIKQEINEVIVYITEILDRHKILSVSTEYFNFLTDDETTKEYSRKFTAFESELIKARLVERTIYFREIFQGKAPNEKINWTGSVSSFRYFINKLFDTKLFEYLSHRWIIASNTFTINGNPVPENIRTYKDKDVKANTKLIINDAISRLID